MDHRCKARVSFVATHCYSLELLKFAKEVLNQMPPLVDIEVDAERGCTLGPLRDDNLCAAFVQLRDDPVRVKGLVGDEPGELDALDQRRYPDRVVSLTGQKDEPHEIAQRVGERQDFGR